jgi:cytochrome c
MPLDPLRIWFLSREPRRSTMRMTRTNGTTSLVVCIGLLWLVPPAAAADGSALATKYNCAACHTPNSKLVGPSYKEIAAKYAGDSGALAKLQLKVKNGGSGVWGAIPMPPNNVPDNDLKTLVEWILAQK